MIGEQLTAHERVGSAQLYVAIDAAKKNRVIVLKQVGGDDHHAIEAVQFLKEIDTSESIKPPGSPSTNKSPHDYEPRA